MKIIPCFRIWLCQFLVLFISTSLNGQDRDIPFTAFATSESISIEALIGQGVFLDKQELPKKTSPSKTFWIRLDFSGQEAILSQNNEWFLRFRNFDFGTLYFQEGDGNIGSYHFGDFDGKDQKQMVMHSKSWFFPFSSNTLIKNRFLYLKVRRVVSVELTKNWNFQYIAPQEKELIGNYYSVNELIGLIPIYVFLGMCLIIFLITLISFFILRKKEFLFYALYIISLSLLLAGFGLNLGNLLFSSPLGGYWFFEILQVVINIFYILFVIYYLDTRKNYPKIHKVFGLIFLVLCCVIVIDAILFFKEYYTMHYRFMNVQRYFILGFAIAAMIYLYRQAKNRFTYFVVLGSSLFILGFIGTWTLHGSMYIIIGGFLELTIFGLGLIYKVRQGYEEKLHFEKVSFVNRGKALRAQINPHFIFNSLSAIQSFITSNNRVAALKYLSKFSRLTRNIMESSIETNVVLTDEIKMLKDYLQLESLRFENVFEYAIHVDDEVDANAVEIPFMILQPFVENAILHGLLPKVQGGKKLNISFKKEGDFIVCEVDDNGVGREMGKQKINIHTLDKKSRGLELTKARLENFGLDPENVQIVDKLDKANKTLGTKVIIKIPENS